MNINRAGAWISFSFFLSEKVFFCPVIMNLDNIVNAIIFSQDL